MKTIRPIAPTPFSKRCLDIAMCLLAAPVAVPLIALAAAVIKLSSRGPAFYVASRAGYRGHPFGQLKLRTMHVGADAAGAFTAKNDCRVFPIGRLIRLFKLDELPQLWNVMRGEMSIVGPRPEEIGIVRECYTDRQRQVLEVAPGLTGVPQVRFFPELSILTPRGTDPQEHYRTVSLPMRLEMDLDYVRQRTIWVDLGLIARTIGLILFRTWRVLLEPSAKAPETRVAEGRAR